MVNDITLTQRIERAMTVRREGANCAQSVVAAFIDVIGEGADKVFNASMGLGAGCGVKEICGVLGGISLVFASRVDPAFSSKKTVYDEMKTVSDLFCRKYGHLRCSDLKEMEHPHPCDELICGGIEILHNHINS